MGKTLSQAELENVKEEGEALSPPPLKCQCVSYGGPEIGLTGFYVSLEPSG